jgi:hypothetical protein
LSSSAQILGTSDLEIPDAAPALEDLGEERALTQLRDLELDVAGLGAEQARPMAVAVVGALVGAFVRRGADDAGRLRVDECLEDELDARADQIDVAAARAKCLEKRVGVKIVLGHWGDLLCRVLPDTSRITPVVRYVMDPLRELHQLMGRRHWMSGPLPSRDPSTF